MDSSRPVQACNLVAYTLPLPLNITIKIILNFFLNGSLGVRTAATLLLYLSFTMSKGKKVWDVGGMIKLFPAKFCDEILRCSSSVWTGVVMNDRNTPAKYATSLILDQASQFLKCVATDTCN